MQFPSGIVAAVLLLWMSMPGFLNIHGTRGSLSSKRPSAARYHVRGNYSVAGQSR